MLGIKRLMPWLTMRQAHDTRLSEEIDRSAQLQEEVQRLNQELDHLKTNYLKKSAECNEKGQALSGFLYVVASKELTISAFDPAGHCYYYDVTFRPHLSDPKDQFLTYDCEYQGHQKVFSRTHIEELIKLILQVGLDQWQATDSTFGFHIKRRFTSEGIYTLAESLKAAEDKLQRLVNELHHLKMMRAVIEEKAEEKTPQ